MRTRYYKVSLLTIDDRRQGEEARRRKDPPYRICTWIRWSLDAALDLAARLPDTAIVACWDRGTCLRVIA